MQVEAHASEGGGQAYDLLHAVVVGADTGGKDEGDLVRLRIGQSGRGEVGDEVGTRGYHGLVDTRIKGPGKVCRKLGEAVTVESEYCRRPGLQLDVICGLI